MIVDGVDADIQVCEVNVIVVESFDTWLKILVVGQCAVQPVDTAYGIGLRTEVYQCVTCRQCTEVRPDAHRVARHV